MSANEEAYSKLWENIVDGEFSMAKCNCITCNSCGCHPSCRGEEWEEIQW